MTKIIGLTGGIGSGKTTVSKIFASYGIPVFNSDVEAKLMMNQDREVKKNIIAHFGEKSYLENALNTSFLSEVVFSDPEKLKLLNSLVHCELEKVFKDWVKNIKKKLIIKEAAILFETDSYKMCDSTILVLSDKNTRIKRVIERDKISTGDILKRMNNQWSDQKKFPIADYIIVNDYDLKTLKKSARYILNLLMTKYEL
ncbi:dephospho-CoA kinase [Ichthyobacterium seriolicida]|uniref:Dephospho-CoA kinase n=1 Tax=Ichthyobacterium seriolicida TaxID=242600 RepID=A0A1J1E060_9FLAO|nr:dephospho-CoA kinase [Ichthyobacterium seriolicida]BAV94317.1 dephospho-CoA kinase [Ichthyobacterium seriolicida]